MSNIERAEIFQKNLIKKKKTKFTFNLTHYTNNCTPIKFNCIEHGEFEAQPYKLLETVGCPGCKKDKNVEIVDIWSDIKKIKNKPNVIKKIDVKPIKFNKIKIHKVKPAKIKKVKIKSYPLYKLKKFFSEIRLLNFLKENYYTVSQGRPVWLGNLRFDCYLPDYNIAVEYQGKQHFSPVNYFGGQETFIKNQERDNRKLNLSLSNNCHLLYFTYSPKDVPENYQYKVFTNEGDLKIQIDNLISLKK